MKRHKASRHDRTGTVDHHSALAQGLTINGLPIMLKRPESIWDIENLDLYFRDCVIGGPGAFMIPVRERHHFAKAIRTKIVREIAAQPEPQAVVQAAQGNALTNCLAGEIRRRERMGN